MRRDLESQIPPYGVKGGEPKACPFASLRACPEEAEGASSERRRKDTALLP